MEMVSKNSSSVYLIGNLNGVGTIKLYSVSNNSTANVNTSMLQAFTSVKQLDSQYILISSNSNIYIFDMINEVLSPLFPGISATQIQVDDITNQIYLAHQNTIKIYSWPALSFQNEISFTDTVSSFHLLYNK